MRARGPPPVAIQNVSAPGSPATATHDPLAANAASPGNGAGNSAPRTAFHVEPPSRVVHTLNAPSIGSPKSTPTSPANAIASKNAPLRSSASTVRQLAPPSSVRSTRAGVPATIARARLPSHASTSRKSQAAASRGATLRHDAPPSVVRQIAPPLPLAQATAASTTARPRRLPPWRASGDHAPARSAPSWARRHAANTAPARQTSDKARRGMRRPTSIVGSR
jgi:hypothetical protein